MMFMARLDVTLECFLCFAVTAINAKKPLAFWLLTITSMKAKKANKSYFNNNTKNIQMRKPPITVVCCVLLFACWFNMRVVLFLLGTIRSIHMTQFSHLVFLLAHSNIGVEDRLTKNSFQMN